MNFVDQSRLRAQKASQDAPTTPPRAKAATPKGKADPARKVVSAIPHPTGQAKLRQAYAKSKKVRHEAEQYGLPLEGGAL